MTHRSAVPRVVFTALALIAAAQTSSRPAAAQQATPPSAAAKPADAPAPATAPAAPNEDKASRDSAPTDAPPPPEAAVPPPTPVAAPPAPSPAEPAPAAQSSWFSRTPLTISSGTGENQLSLTFYGFVQADFIHDTTQSYNDAIGDTLVARSDVFEGTKGRTQFSTRNTRLGLALKSPEIAGMRPSAVLEGDFFGNQPNHPPQTSETAYFDSGTFRLRHAYVKLESAYVDVLIGQSYDLFGWQNYYFPATAEFLGIPNQVFSRHTQLRLSHTFGADGPVGVTLGASAARPGQRDSAMPDFNAGLRIGVNGWKGITTPGNTNTTALPLSLGVSGVVRQFKVDAYTPPPTQNANAITGWGLSIDALLPILAAQNADDRGNKLTLTGSFVIGSGIGDLMTATGGARFPTLPNPAQANPPPEYTGNIDNGIVTFDRLGVLHTIDWQAFRAGLQYYLPPSGRVSISINYTQAHSKNMRNLYPQGGAEIELLTHVAETTRFADANIFWDATPAVRFGIAGAYTTVEYLDGDKPHNIRGHLQALYAF
ncbi:MAG: hypothetical protein ACOY0T_38410 [Myxococcota bacterium]